MGLTFVSSLSGNFSLIKCGSPCSIDVQLVELGKFHDGDERLHRYGN